MDSSAASAPSGARRGPGRPPRRPPAPPLPHFGVLSAPLSSDNRFELVYSNPAAFKNLFSFFKATGSRDLRLRCRPDGLTFFTRDRGGGLRLSVHVAGRLMNSFFCEGEFVVGLNRETIDRFVANIDSSFDRFSIFLSHFDRDSVTFVLRDPSVDKRSSYVFPLVDLPLDEALFDAERFFSDPLRSSSFPLSFSLPSKAFKKSICDANAYCPSAVFELLGDAPLTLSCEKPGFRYCEQFSSPEKIALSSSLPPGSLFRCDFSLEPIHALAGSSVTEAFRLFCSDRGSILFQSNPSSGPFLVSCLLGNPDLDLEPLPRAGGPCLV